LIFLRETPRIFARLGFSGRMNLATFTGDRVSSWVPVGLLYNCVRSCFSWLLGSESNPTLPSQTRATRDFSGVLMFYQQ
jgi:hypothetical protein